MLKWSDFWSREFQGMEGYALANKKKTLTRSVDFCNIKWIWGRRISFISPHSYVFFPKVLQTAKLLLESTILVVEMVFCGYLQLLGRSIGTSSSYAVKSEWYELNFLSPAAMYSVLWPCFLIFFIHECYFRLDFSWLSTNKVPISLYWGNAELLCRRMSSHNQPFKHVCRLTSPFTIMCFKIILLLFVYICPCDAFGAAWERHELLVPSLKAMLASWGARQSKVE